ncbi:hypothetical protein TIFTF001_026196 [Ficus carica]|uniref:Peptidase C1A papain C-terminal domain-containing protein n=1 Tax=Ficus carica TaxID=3494 RepID=A0AA88DKT2_FICCA|nr:hypothetical protein TIFTF001_026196 [Ficus carica]
MKREEGYDAGGSRVGAREGGVSAQRGRRGRRRESHRSDGEIRRRMEQSSLHPTCWAESIASCLEAQLRQFHHIDVRLSIQELVNSVPKDPPEGGSIREAPKFIMKYGMRHEEDYPYSGLPNFPPLSPPRELYGRRIYPLRRHNGYSVLTNKNGDTEILHWLRRSPLIAGLFTDKKFDDVEWDIYSTKKRNTEDDHSVVLAGYGVAIQTKYLLIQNSFGSSWGINGYGRILNCEDYRIVVFVPHIRPIEELFTYIE